MADAEDVVQETFVRALERPPARTDEPWRPWLVRVATNVGRDLLRRRRRRRYPGVFVPSPVATDEPASDEPSPAARYDLVESATLAFLLALEALTPNQRAVLLLRDVFDHSVRETAEALRLREDNVKTTHLRARRALRAYDERRRRPTRAVQQETREALHGLLAALSQGDAAAVGRLLSDDVRSLADGGGVYFAAAAPQEGRAAVARLYLGLATKAGRVTVEETTVAGLPAVVLRQTGQPPGWAPVALIQCELDPTGRIARLYSVMAPAKLGAVGPGDGSAALPLGVR